jgi:hypothetical protein
MNPSEAAQMTMSIVRTAVATGSETPTPVASAT